MNPFNSERTGVSGFGSRSKRKTIFASPNQRLSKATSRQEEDHDDDIDDDNKEGKEHIADTVVQAPISLLHDTDDDDDDFDGSLPFPDILSPTTKRCERRLFALRSPQALWIRIEEDGNSQHLLRLVVSKQTGDWMVERRPLDEDPALNDAAAPIVDDESIKEQWAPIEGFYGMYRVPSGILWVLVTQTEPVYTAPSLVGSEEDQQPNVWQIRRISNFEIVHVSRPELNTLTASQLREEVRQLKLLRRSLKHHDFYFYAPFQIQDGKRDTDEEASSGSWTITDITKPLQRSILEINALHGDTSISWWKTTNEDLKPDPRFFWNQVAITPLVKLYNASPTGSHRQELADILLSLVVPVTSAFVGVQSVTVACPGDQSNESDTTTEVGKLAYDEILVSRRSRFRAGTRFTVRGADATGAVANFVETEQICLMKVGEANALHSLASQVQTRGSIPLRWSSPADVKTYRPRVHIGTDPLAQARALKLHLLDQVDHYVLPRDDDSQSDDSTSRNIDEDNSEDGTAPIIFVNLVDKKSDQGRLGTMFDAVLQAVLEVEGNVTSNPTLAPLDIRHHWFDFHGEVKGGRWDRLGLLLKDMIGPLMSHGYFACTPPEDCQSGWTIHSKQYSVVRTNCMDCLDRTNVVQSLFGRYMLFRQLSLAADALFQEGPKAVEDWWRLLAKKFNKNPLALPFKKGEKAHRHLWADNADAISRLYAGTNALKGDFTRTGKRTKMGALDDGMNSLQRYYLNNFLDADRQEGYDLMVGQTGFNIIDEEDMESTPTTASPDEKGETQRLDLIRQALLGTADEREQSNDSFTTSQSSLDLHWIPGDLQTHLKSNAIELLTSADTELLRLGSYEKSQALRALDVRSRDPAPWWTQCTSDSRADANKLVHDAEIIVSDPNPTDEWHQHQVLTLPIQLASVFALGVLAPNLLTAVTTAILSFVFMQDLIENDTSLVKCMAASFQRRFNDWIDKKATSSE